MPVAHGHQSLTFYKIELIKAAWAHSDSFNPNSARILKEGTSSSNESMTSIPYTNANGVAPVDVHTKVR